MIIQALILSFALSIYSMGAVTLRKSMEVSLSFGLFLAAYIVLAEPAKYVAPSIQKWIIVEAGASTLQFVLFGFAFWFIHRRKA